MASTTNPTLTEAWQEVASTPCHLEVEIGTVQVTFSDTEPAAAAPFITLTTSSSDARSDRHTMQYPFSGKAYARAPGTGAKLIVVT